MEYYINHRFKDVVILPLMALHPNVGFACQKDRDMERIVATADGIRCKVVNWSCVNILAIEDKIRELYNIDVITFLKKWYSVDNAMDSLYMLVLELKKI